MAEHETSAPELKPTMEVYRAIVALAGIKLQTADGVDEFMDAACVLVPHKTRDELFAMDMGALALLVREQTAAVAPLFETRVEGVAAIAQADDLVNGAE